LLARTPARAGESSVKRWGDFNFASCCPLKGSREKVAIQFRDPLRGQQESCPFYPFSFILTLRLSPAARPAAKPIQLLSAYGKIINFSLHKPKHSPAIKVK
jgi:hypothetical protein